jgi:hypothetical protein
MQTKLTILLWAALLGYVINRGSDRLKAVPHQHRTWWQRPLVLLALLVALLIVSTPEFFALGLIGDSTFFDLLVLLISLEFQGFGGQARCWLAGLMSKVTAWVMRPRMSYLLVLSIWMVLVDLATCIGAAWHRLSSGA